MSYEPLPNSEIILYQTEDGRTRVQCRFENETLWLTQALIADLFEKDVRTINEHLVNIFDEGELRREATIRKFRIVRIEGARQVTRELEHHNLDAILAVGFPRAQPSRRAVPPVGHRALKRVSGEGLHHGRRAAQESAGQGSEGLLRRATGAHPRHPLLRTALLSEGARYLCNERGLHAGHGGVAAVFCHGAEQDALGGTRADGV